MEINKNQHFGHSAGSDCFKIHLKPFWILSQASSGTRKSAKSSPVGLRISEISEKWQRHSKLSNPGSGKMDSPGLKNREKHFWWHGWNRSRCFRSFVNFAPFSFFLIRIDCPKTVPSPRDAASQNALGRGEEGGGGGGLLLLPNSGRSQELRISGSQDLRLSGSQDLWSLESPWGDRQKFLRDQKCPGRKKVSCPFFPRLCTRESPPSTFLIASPICKMRWQASRCCSISFQQKNNRTFSMS